MGDRREELFQAVLDDPGADAPRFAYAGYCDAQGDPYGAFIRAQLARSQALREGSDDDASRYEEEARRLEAAHRSSAWTNGVENLARLPTFVRGFVGSVVVHGDRYVSVAEDLFQRAPLRHLVVSEVGERVAEVVRDPHLIQVVSLVLANTSGNRPIGDAGLAAVISSPHLRSLRVLEIAQQGITIEGIEMLCRSKALPELIYVNLVGNRFEDPRERFGTDWATNQIVPESVALPPLGRELEAKYGHLPWLHAASRLRHVPPTDDEL